MGLAPSIVKKNKNKKLKKNNDFRKKQFSK